MQNLRGTRQSEEPGERDLARQDIDRQLRGEAESRDDGDRHEQERDKQQEVVEHVVPEGGVGLSVHPPRAEKQVAEFTNTRVKEGSTIKVLLN